MVSMLRWLDRDENGYVFKVGDVGTLAGHLMALVEDQERRSPGLIPGSNC